MTEPHISERLRGETMPFRDLRTTRRNELLYEAASHIEKLEEEVERLVKSRNKWGKLYNQTLEKLRLSVMSDSEYVKIIDEKCVEQASHIEKLEAALRAICDEEVPRNVAISYRDDGTPSKHDRCAHHEWMYNYCPYCIMEYAEKKLEELK